MPRELICAGAWYRHKFTSRWGSRLTFCSRCRAPKPDPDQDPGSNQKEMKEMQQQTQNLHQRILAGMAGEISGAPTITKQLRAVIERNKTSHHQNWTTELRLTVEVKQIKKIQGQENHLYHWLEISSKGKPGWLYKAEVDLYAFETPHSFLLVESHRLRHFAEGLQENMQWSKGRPEVYKLTRYSDCVLLLVLTHDLRQLAFSEVPK
jgi:hypothetical protein